MLVFHIPAAAACIAFPAFTARSMAAFVALAGLVPAVTAVANPGSWPATTR